VTRRLLCRLAVLSILALPTPPLGTSSALAQAAPLTSSSVRASVLGVAPSTPAPTDTPQLLTVELRLLNTTDQTLNGLRVLGDRGNPINSQAALDAAIAQPRPPDPFLDSPIKPVQDVLTNLGAGASTVVKFVTRTSRQRGDGLCLCADAIYPLYFTIHYLDVSGTDRTVGTVQTYLPAFGTTTPQPVQVSWVWPLIDRPHRLDSDTVFFDDELATSVSTGRLDRALRVVEQVGPDVPMTLVLDPELLDELAVMSTGRYLVQTSPTARPTAGTGANQAAAWLDRLSTVLTADRALDVRFTAPADPEIDSLTAHGLSWNPALGPAAEARVENALAGFTAPTTLAWPATTTVHPATLSALQARGVSTVLLGSRALTGLHEATFGGRAGVDLADVEVSGSRPLAAVATAQVTQAAAAAVSLGSDTGAALPVLVAQVALRAAAQPEGTGYVVVQAPRYVDPADGAAAAIVATTKVFWAHPVTIAAAVASLPAVTARLADPTAAGLSAATISTVSRAAAVERVVTSMVSPTGADVLLAGLAPATQRVESSAWLADPQLGGGVSSRFAAHLVGLISGVYLVRPKTGTYTLASANSPLPLAVHNGLDAAVQVRVEVSAANAAPGLSAEDIGVRSIAAHTTVTLHVPLRVERSGRFQVRAQLLTPAHAPLGAPVYLSVHSTALGTIGLVITVAAGAVLLIALLVRLVARLRRGPTDRLAAPEVVP
jgi:Family of unknown function (DUF6049)